MAIYNFEEEKNKNNHADYQKISGIICISVSVISLFCLITHFVPFAKSFLYGVFGLLCYPLFITMLAIGFALINHKKYIMPKKYVVLLLCSIISVLCILQLISVRNAGLTFWEYISRCYTQKSTAGGVFAGLLTAPALYILNRLGAYIIFTALAVIFIALTADYIHYLGKNEILKKAIKVAGANGQSERIKNITVKELENSLKASQKNNKQAESSLKTEKNEASEKVKLTLNAKQESQLSSEEIAKRKLGLLASSKQDELDNSRYFTTAQMKDEIALTKVNVLQNRIKTDNENLDNRLSQIQANLIELKKKANYSSYNVKKSDPTSFAASNNSQGYYYQSKNIENDNIIVSKKQTSLLDNTAVDLKDKQPSISIIDNTETDEHANPYSLAENFKSIEETIKENEKNHDSLEIENFSNNVMELLRNNGFNKTDNTNKKEETDTVNNESVEIIPDDYDLSSSISIVDGSDLNGGNNIVLPHNKSFDQESNLNRRSLNNTISNHINQEQISDNTINYVSTDKVFAGQEPVIEPIKPKIHVNYVQPPIELLTTQSMDTAEVSPDVVMKREELEMALDTFGIPAKVIGVVIGPAVTRYELEMPAGISIKRLLSIQDDIAYNLSSNGDIRIEAPIPGRRAVGIEVPNDKVATVGLRDIIMSREFMETKSSLAIALGKDISGMIKTFSLVKIPHLLIAGTTGSGKSVCINAIILSLIYKYSPDEVKLILVDPKRVEFSMYNHLPHLLMPNVITDSEKALNALSWCVDEMEKRFITFANARVKNLEEYNESEAVLEGKADKLPYIIFIIDELADLLMTSKKDAEDQICRLLQKARAAGIHMILATQRPSVDVVTGKIKANLNARICFSLMTSADSKTVLDQGGADKLLGKGDMLFMSSDTGVPKRIQGCFVTTKEIDDVVNFVKENNGDYEFDAQTEQAIINPPKNDVITQIDGDRASSDGFDALMPQVLKSVIESGHASISMIQRKFLVGFPRAARIIDQMEQAGYISPSDGTKTRSVYMTMDEYDELYGNDS